MLRQLDQRKELLELGIYTPSQSIPNGLLFKYRGAQETPRQQLRRSMENLNAKNSIPQARAAIQKAIAEGNTHLIRRFQEILNAEDTLEEDLIDLDNF
jgi:hypothetical protein